MSEAMDLGGPVGSALVSNRYFQNLKIELGCSEQQIEISEGIELSKIRSVGGDVLVVSSKQDFRSAERVLDPFTQ